MFIKKNLTALVISCLIMAYSSGADAFTCRDAQGNKLNSGNITGSLNVYVNIDPILQTDKVLVVNLSNSISCLNNAPGSRNDMVRLAVGSAYGGVLDNFIGTLRYYNYEYNFPLRYETSSVNITEGYYTPWRVQLFLTPISTASGVVIRQGRLIAKLVMRQVGSNISDGGNIHTATFTWNIYANNNVVVPTGGCDVSSRNVAVRLPDYPGTAAVPLTVHCAKDQRVAYYLTGTTTDTASTLFANTSSSNPAKGIGVQLSNNKGVIATNKRISLGTVGTGPVSLGLTTSYARTSGQVVAGDVQSVIGVTFVYE
ncbi:fimbrial protein [Erwinia sp. J316]|uniref:Fimbrial protein n=1 Tax=Erwinia sorbitola TaxID=2681984 RepID=A0ABW9RHE3_9GAMM|nr:fimbrial protein [Erwinia sorbitola]MTD29408.1 fimbrial protein [Erwinia sorbitola]